MLIDGFSKECSNIATIYLKVRDESMNVILFRTTWKGDLPHLSYIFCKPEPLGTEFKKVACSVTGALIFLEIQRGKEEMDSSRYHLELGTTAAYTKMLMEETKGMGQRAVKVSTSDCLLFYTWF